MNPITRFTPGLGLAGLAYLTQIGLAAAHAGEHHPAPASDVPWPIAGPVIALLVSGAAYWLTNRDHAPHSPAIRVATPLYPTAADLNQASTHDEASSGPQATGRNQRIRTELVSLRSSKPPTLSVGRPQPPRSAIRTPEDTWITNDVTR